MSEIKEPESAKAPLIPQHPRGYTMADEEMERLVDKRESGDVLDPIALDDPVGMSVEKVIVRAAVVVVFVLVVGLLFAQVACKNIQKWGVPTFESGVNEAMVEKALSAGIGWAGEIIRFPEMELVEFSQETGVVKVFVNDTSHRTLEQLVESSQDKAFVLAMALMVDPTVEQLVYVVNSTVDPQTGKFSATGSRSELGQVLSISWQRSADGTFVCEMGGFDPAAATVSKSLKE